MATNGLFCNGQQWWGERPLLTIKVLAIVDHYWWSLHVGPGPKAFGGTNALDDGLCSSRTNLAYALCSSRTNLALVGAFGRMAEWPKWPFGRHFSYRPFFTFYSINKIRKWPFSAISAIRLVSLPH